MYTYFKWGILLIAIVIILSTIFFIRFNSIKENKTSPYRKESSQIKLPEPLYRSNTSIEEALKQRRSIRAYKNDPLNLADVSQLLWAAQGITSERGLRTAPSAGALYPLEVYIVSGHVKDLPAGCYHYLPTKHALELLALGDKRSQLAEAAYQQSDIASAAADMIITGIYERTTKKYGERGKQYVQMESGHVAENIFLQTVSLKIGTVVIGAFNEDAVKKILPITKGEVPLYIMPVGKV